MTRRKSKVKTKSNDTNYSQELRLITEAAKHQKSQDAFSNPLNRTGANTPNLLDSTEYPLQRLSFDYMRLQSLYRSHWIIRRIIDTIPEDMCKNWISFETQATPDEIKQVELCMKETYVSDKFVEAMKWARLFGGAGALIMIDGHEDILDQPLYLSMIMPDSFCGLMVLDRWSGLSPTGELIDDPRDPEFGLPKYYNITTQTQESFKVHHSRILRFIGRDVPRWEKQAEMYWGVSEVEHVFDELKKRDNVSWNIALLTFRANLIGLKMNDLGQLMAMGDPASQRDLYNTLSAQNQIMNNQGMLILDREDSMEQRSYSFGGLSEVMEKFMMDISGAAEIPATKLFGRSPEGMNSTGESDSDNYDDSIGQKQAFHMNIPLRKLIPIVWLSVHGRLPNDLDFKFNPIGNMSNKDKTELADKGSELIGKAYDRGLISQRTALREMKQLSSLTGFFSNITDEDIANSDDSLQTMNQPEMPGMEDMPEQPPQMGGQLGEQEQEQGNDNAPTPTAVVLDRLDELLSRIIEKKQRPNMK